MKRELLQEICVVHLSILTFSLLVALLLAFTTSVDLRSAYAPMMHSDLVFCTVSYPVSNFPKLLLHDTV